MLALVWAVVWPPWLPVAILERRRTQAWVEAVLTMAVMWQQLRQVLPLVRLLRKHLAAVEPQLLKSLARTLDRQLIAVPRRLRILARTPAPAPALATMNNLLQLLTHQRYQSVRRLSRS